MMYEVHAHHVMPTSSPYSLHFLNLQRHSFKTILIYLYRSDVNNTCPICRDEIHGNKDYWEVPEPPSKKEIGNFVLGMAEGAGAPT